MAGRYFDEWEPGTRMSAYMRNGNRPPAVVRPDYVDVFCGVFLPSTLFLNTTASL
jgi:hypothetical protein